MKFSALSVGTTPAGTELIPAVQGGQTVTLTASQLAQSTAAALTKTDDTNVTLTLGGTPSAAVLKATSITVGWTGRLALSRFATGTSGYALTGNGASDSSYQGFLQAGTGATTRTWLAKAQDVVSVKDFGAVGDGTTDDTTAIQAAITAAAAKSPAGAVYVPSGAYKTSSALTGFGGITIYGDGPHNTTIKSSSTTANIFTIASDYTTVRDIGFAASVTRSGGSYIATSGFHVQISNIHMEAPFVGINITNHVRMSGAHIVNTVASTGKAILIDAADQEIRISDLLIDAANGSQPLYGIQVLQVGDLILSDFDILHSGIGMIVNPSSGNATALWLSNGFFDTNSSHGFLIAPSGTGIVQDSHLHGIWSATSASGNQFALDASGSGAVKNISFVNCFGVNCAAGQGLAVLVGSNVTVNGGLFTGNNQSGIYIAANINDFSITGVTSGAYGRFSGNGQYGINVVAGTSDKYVIANNRLSGNSVAALTDGGTGTAARVWGNIGYNPVGVTAAATMGASPTTVTAGHAPETHYVRQSATNTATIAKGGQQVATLAGATTYYTIELGPNEAYVTTWLTTAPTYTKDVH